MNRYIQSKADMLGCTAQEIRGRLNSSFTFEDIDRICEDVQRYKLNISTLPFDVTQGNIKIVESKQPSILSSMYDDTVDDQLLQMAKVKY